MGCFELFSTAFVFWVMRVTVMCIKNTVVVSRLSTPVRHLLLIISWPKSWCLFCLSTKSNLGQSRYYNVCRLMLKALYCSGLWTGITLVHNWPWLYFDLAPVITTGAILLENNEAFAKLIAANGWTFTSSQPYSVANHVTARSINDWRDWLLSLAELEVQW